MYGTASRAAEAIGVSQPAVSKAIFSLEKSIGFKLFDRIKGRLVPTAEGQLYFREVRHAFASIAKLRSAAARIRDYGSGDIKVGTRAVYSANIVPSAVAAFRRVAPDISVSVHISSSSVLRDMVAANQLDIAVVADEVDLSGVEAEAFRDDPAVVVMPPDHPLALQDLLSPLDLHQQDFITSAPDDGTRREAEDLFAQYKSVPRTIMETSFFSTTCALAADAGACGLVHPVSAMEYSNRGLVARPLEPAVYIRTLLLFSQGPKSKFTNIMRDFLNSESEAAASRWEARLGKS